MYAVCRHVLLVVPATFRFRILLLWRQSAPLERVDCAGSDQTYSVDAQAVGVEAMNTRFVSQHSRQHDLVRLSTGCDGTKTRSN